MPDWKSPATMERLIAALVASNNCKVDCQAIARYMDETYDAVENRTRSIKKEAQKLIKEAEEAGRMDMDMRKRKDGNSNANANASPRKPRATPKKNGDLHGVASGRVVKSPTKPRATPKKNVKQENTSSDSSVFGGDFQTTGASFAFADMNFSQDSFNGNVDEWNNGLA